MFNINIKFISFSILLSLLFSFFFSMTISHAQAPMTVFGVASSATADIKILVNDQDCKEAKILVEPNSSTGYIFLAYVDEGECSAFEGSKISFKVNGQVANETILWRKGGAPKSATGLNLTLINQSGQSGESSKDSNNDNIDSKKQQAYPALPGPPEKPKDTEEKEAKTTPSLVNEATKEKSAMSQASTNESASKVKPSNDNTKKQSTTVIKPMNEGKTIIENNDEGSNNRTIIITGLVTLLVLLSFYSLASRR